LNKRTKKVIAMEIESTNHQSERCACTSMIRREADAGPSEDVAEPDLIASGVAGTGHEYQNRNGMTGKQEGNNSLRLGKTKHHYNISIRTRLIRREFRPVPDPVPIILPEEEGVA
jgi:hypothetical protein